MRYPGSITDIQGLWVGHSSDHEARTGCTVLICTQPACCGVDVSGGAPGTRETALLAPGKTVDRVNAVLLTGGSAFGLDAAGGVMAWLEQRGWGYETGYARVPIVPAAVLYDLGVGRADRRPEAAMGFAACENAAAAAPAQGAVGAGTGATVGKILGPGFAMAGGIGTASVSLGGVTVAAMVAVNAVGNIVDYHTGETVAGARNEQGWIDPAALLLGGQPAAAQPGTNTTIGIIATDARLDKTQLCRLSRVAQDGLALSIRPVHTSMDGDTLFALSAGDREENFDRICVAAVEAVSRAVVNAVVGTP
jgi:L-aminopeptidase/D-esterase-like protein